MIANNPVDLAKKMLRFENREKAIRVLNSTRQVSVVWSVAIFALWFGITCLQIWMLRDRLPKEILVIAIGLMAPIGLYIGQLIVDQRRLQALVDLVLLDVDETADAEHEAQLQKSAKGKQLTEAAS